MYILEENQNTICTQMFIAAVTIAKIWKHLKYHSTEEWLKKCDIYIHIYIHIYVYIYIYIYIYIHIYTHTMEYYSAITKNEILPFAAMWTDLGNIMLNEISQRKTNTV